jgi:hypothetical protein
MVTFKIMIANDTEAMNINVFVTLFQVLLGV